MPYFTYTENRFKEKSWKNKKYSPQNRVSEMSCHILVFSVSVSECHKAWQNLASNSLLSFIVKLGTFHDSNSLSKIYLNIPLVSVCLDMTPDRTREHIGCTSVTNMMSTIWICIVILQLFPPSSIVCIYNFELVSRIVSYMYKLSQKIIILQNVIKLLHFLCFCFLCTYDTTWKWQFVS